MYLFCTTQKTLKRRLSFFAQSSFSISASLAGITFIIIWLSLSISSCSLSFGFSPIISLIAVNALVSPCKAFSSWAIKEPFHKYSYHLKPYNMRFKSTLVSLSTGIAKYIRRFSQCLFIVLYFVTCLCSHFCYLFVFSL